MKNIRIVLLVLFIILLNVIDLRCETREWEQLYPQIDSPVYNIQYYNGAGLNEFGLMFALPGDAGGLGYFTESNEFEIFNFSTNLGAVSIQPDEENARVFCAFGEGSWSDGLYKFDMESSEFELMDWFAFPNFVKKTASGFYHGYLYGLVHSAMGHVWEPVEYFNGMDVTDVEEYWDGPLFVSSGHTLYMENSSGFSSIEAILEINDIFIMENGQVYIACGFGTDSDAVYQVEFDSEEITGLTMINYFPSPNRLFQYMNKLVVGCKDGGGLYLITPVENGEIEQIEQDLPISEVYCFNTFPINTPNFILGSDTGLYLVTQPSSVGGENSTLPVQEVILSNHPNPFNPSTEISFSLNTEITENTEIEIYNIKGQKTLSLPVTLSGVEGSGNDYTVSWNGTNQNNSPVASGVYYAVLKSGNKILGSRKMLLMK